MKALDLLQGTLGPHGADGGSAMRGGALASTSTQIVAVCGSGADRPDHDLGNMSTLIERADRRIALVGKRCITRCLPGGHNSLRLVAAEGPECGLVPIAGCATCSINPRYTTLPPHDVRWDPFWSPYSTVQTYH